MWGQLRNTAILLLLGSFALAGTESLRELKARADAAHGSDRVRLCMEYAHRELEDANDLYTKGDVDGAQREILEVLEYARKSADAATASGKHLKDTEIELRKLAKRMHDIGESLNFEDREPVRKAVQNIEQIRSDLLDRMFGIPPEPKEKS